MGKYALQLRFMSWVELSWVLELVLGGADLRCNDHIATIYTANTKLDINVLAILLI